MTPEDIGNTLMRAYEGGYFDDVPAPEERGQHWTDWVLVRARELIGPDENGHPRIYFADLRAGGWLDAQRPGFARTFWQGIFGRGKARRNERPTTLIGGTRIGNL